MAPEPTSNSPSAEKAQDSNEAAVDDSTYANDDFVDIQRTISLKRREEKEHSAELPIQRLLPFPFSPNIRPLTSSDHAACVALENAAFPRKEHQASPEKVAYRLAQCPELSMGVFCTVPGGATDFELATMQMAKPVETDRENKAVSVLLAYILATKSSAKVVTDNDMDYPREWKTSQQKTPGIGHQEAGRTVAIHSLAVLPKLHGCGLGKLIMKSYLQQIKTLGTADRVALICQDYLINYYQRFGFQNMGESKAEFGGGGWNDMVFEFESQAKTPM